MNRIIIGACKNKVSSSSSSSSSKSRMLMGTAASLVFLVPTSTGITTHCEETNEQNNKKGSGWSKLAFWKSSNAEHTATNNNNEDNNNISSSLMGRLLQKDADGNTDWSASANQITKPEFWDTVATISGEKLQTAVDTGIPTQLSYGFASGFCSGYALRAAGRGVAVVLGLGFMSLQTLQYYGYVQVDHTKFQQDFNKALDWNEDGKVDSEDAQLAYNKIQEVLQYSVPAGGGFGAGFIAGLRRG